MGIFRLLILGALAYLFYRLVRVALGSHRSVDRKRGNGVIDEMVQDPNCRIYIPRRDARRKTVAGREYFFCSKECADQYEEGLKG
ncbi:MAG: YHS domain-containing protein [Pseudomonadota bacterium]